MRRYTYRGRTFQFEDGKAPDGAVEVKVMKPETKKAPKKKTKKEKKES